MSRNVQCNNKNSKCIVPILQKGSSNSWRTISNIVRRLPRILSTTGRPWQFTQKPFNYMENIYIIQQWTFIYQPKAKISKLLLHKNRISIEVPSLYASLISKTIEPSKNVILKSSKLKTKRYSVISIRKLRTMHRILSTTI